MNESIKNIEWINDKKYKNLIKEYVDVIEQRDNFMLKKQMYLDAKHIIVSYDLMKEELSTKMSIKKLNIEKNMIKSSIKLQKPLDKEKIGYLINKEIEPLEEYLKCIDDLAHDAKYCIYRYEEYNAYNNEVSNLYKKLIIRISPIFNYMNSNKEKLWRKIELSYIYNDLNKLKIISNIVEENHKINKIYTKEELCNNINDLNNEINSMKEIYPFNVEEYINDRSYINQYRNEIIDRIIELKEDERMLKIEVNILKSKI